MDTYSIEIREVHSTYLEVEAGSEEEALDIASAYLVSGELPDGSEIYDSTYEYTLN